jgi:hypothetical protein
MVDSINDKRFDSWEEYYEKRGEETTGLTQSATTPCANPSP